MPSVSSDTGEMHAAWISLGRAWEGGSGATSWGTQQGAPAEGDQP